MTEILLRNPLLLPSQDEGSKATLTKDMVDVEHTLETPKEETGAESLATEDTLKSRRPFGKFDKKPQHKTLQSIWKAS